jgi:hypothetical protein
MKVPKHQEAFLREVMTAGSPKRQRSLRAMIQGEDYDDHIENAYLMNPFFRLTEEESRTFNEDQDPSAIRRLIAARDAASRATTPKYSVFCMPKSGSSFVRTALQFALNLPVMSLTSFGTPGASSFFGMNSREQEIDELALTKAILKAPDGFISQNHTRYSMYLALQMRTFQITPIITVRNILDCIVSFDDMMMTWRTGQGEHAWLSDAQFALPMDYTELEAARRFEILGRSFGVWLISFFLSWKRCGRQDLISPIMVKYEEDILDRDRFVELITSHIPMSDFQRERLARYAGNPDRKRARLNVGVSGRGRQAIPEHVVEFLLDHVKVFHGEISEDEMRYLIR